MAKRTSDVIEAEIAKLTKELDGVRLEERKLTSAVHVLHNLGWTFDGGSWKKPVVKQPDPFSAFKTNPFREGDYVTHKLMGGKYRVCESKDGMIQIQAFHHRECARLIFLKSKTWAFASGYHSIPSSSL